MQIGMIGLGKMGANMALRLQKNGYDCVVYDSNPAAVDSLVGEGVQGAHSLSAFAQQLTFPRVAWLMVPAGAPTDESIQELAQHFSSGDIIINGGNSFYQDDIRYAKELGRKNIHFMDAGTSGGVWGRERGYCLMLGGEKSIFQHCEPIFKTLAPGIGDIARTPKLASESTAERGYLYCGPVGAGHFVKMIHNGIEYGLMQAYAEGFEILQKAGNAGIPLERRYDFNLAEIAEVWRRGSVVGSWLLDLLSIALNDNSTLSQYQGDVQDSGEGRWTLNAAIEEAVSANVLGAALFARFRSRSSNTFADKILSALRCEFGGHQESKVKE